MRKTSEKNNKRKIKKPRKKNNKLKNLGKK